MGSSVVADTTYTRLIEHVFEFRRCGMATIVDEAVDVDLAADGDPLAFVWKRFEHRVIGQPQALFSRQAWWTGDSSPARIDIETWRVDAARGDEEPTRYDLRRDTAGRWTLAVAWT